jgi:hypothetical protein
VHLTFNYDSILEMAIELASRVNTTYPTNPTFADGANLERGIVYWGQVNIWINRGESLVYLTKIPDSYIDSIK